VLLLHGNSPVHTTQIAMDALSFRSYEEINDPRNLNEGLRGRHFKDNDDLNAAVNWHFISKSDYN
jgi:hypothetical protein